MGGVMLCARPDCAERFQRTVPNRKFCSQRCQVIEASRRYQGYYAMPSTEIRTCLRPDCGEPFRITRRQRRMVYCSSRCMKREGKRRRSDFYVREERSCVECGGGLSVRQSSSRQFCSAACQGLSWRTRNGTAIRQRYREWRKRTPRLARLRKMRRRAAKAAAPHRPYSLQDVGTVFRDQAGRCWWCGKHTNLTIDHVHPLSRGGADAIDNIVGACLPCNSGKKDRLWRRRDGQLGREQEIVR